MNCFLPMLVYCLSRSVRLLVTVLVASMAEQALRDRIRDLEGEAEKSQATMREMLNRLGGDN